jgi:hypothetical protein
VIRSLICPASGDEIGWAEIDKTTSIHIVDQDYIDWLEELGYIYIRDTDDE